MAYRDPRVQAAASRRSYVRNRDQIRERHRARKEAQRQLIRNAKDCPCTDCGESFPYFVMDFDHVRGEKKYEINRLGTIGVSDQTIIDEIAKCEVVCANCHRIRTHAPMSLPAA